MKKMLKTAVALVLSACLMASSVLAAPATFSDVPSSYWGYSFISRAAQEGLVSGLGDGTYGVSASLSNAQFTTMVCNLFYKSDVETYQKTYKPTYWWQSYMAVAYSKGLLDNTAVGDNRKLSNAWSTQAVNASMSRYDMAQVMSNVAKDQGWTDPSALDLLAAQLKIADWANIPAKYQNAVAKAYAKGFLSGMDNNKFEGAQAMTRTHGAVVLCKLLDAKNTEKSNVYTNTTKLVNGDTPNKDNVEDALMDLKREFPNNSNWDTTASYTSNVLGKAIGNNAFAFTMSDRIFGAMDYEEGEPEDLKVGDVVYLRSEGLYVIVQDVDGDEFTYAYCTSKGKISWGNDYEIDELGSRDTIYTRYGFTSNKLSNGEKITEDNVEDLLKDFRDEEYDDGAKWDMDKTYKSTAFYKNNVKGSRAFAYYVSDYVFGEEIEAVEMDFEEIRAGDVVYLEDYDDYNGYVVATYVDDDEFEYVCVTSAGRVRWDLDPIKIEDLTDDDAVYSRYDDVDEDEDEDEDDEPTLSNGKEITAKNVKNLLADFKDEAYDDGDKWDMSASKKYSAFSTSKVKGSRAFAYEVSEYVFEDLEVEQLDDFEDVRVGDVVYIYESEKYYVVVSIDKKELTCVGTKDNKGTVDWDIVIDLDDLKDEDEIHTRYPAEEEEVDTLSNGKVATTSNVKKLIESFREDEYDEEGEWDTEEAYKSPEFTGNKNKKVYGSEAFAYYFSDYIFGELAVEIRDDAADVRVGDVVELWDEELIGVVISIDTSDDWVEMLVAAEDHKKYDDGEIFAYGLYIEDMDDEDTVYTRYPS